MTPLRQERRGPVLLLTLDRPRQHNAMNPELVCRLADAFDAFGADQSLHAAVLTGAGEASFCSGGDLATTLPLLSGARAPQDAWDRRLLDEPETLARSTLKGVVLDKPVIAAVNGACLAGGLELMLAADIRFAAPHASFGLPEVRHGLIPFAGALVRLPREIPQALAMEMLLTGRAISAERALAAGLINRIVPGAALLGHALDTAAEIAANGPLAVQAVKQVVRTASGRPLSEGFAAETQAMARVMATKDAREGPAAFIEKRKPVFRGM